MCNIQLLFKLTFKVVNEKILLADASVYKSKQYCIIYCTWYFKFKAIYYCSYYLKTILVYNSLDFLKVLICMRYNGTNV